MLEWLRASAVGAVEAAGVMVFMALAFFVLAVAFVLNLMRAAKDKLLQRQRIDQLMGRDSTRPHQKSSNEGSSR